MSCYQRATLQNAATATGAGTAMQLLHPNFNPMTDVVMQVLGGFSATIAWQGTVDGNTWTPVRAENLETGTMATTTNATGLYRINVRGLAAVRANITSYTSGQVTVVGAAIDA